MNSIYIVPKLQENVDIIEKDPLAIIDKDYAAQQRAVVLLRLDCGTIWSPRILSASCFTLWKSRSNMRQSTFSRRRNFFASKICATVYSPRERQDSRFSMLIWLHKIPDARTLGFFQQLKTDEQMNDRGDIVTTCFLFGLNHVFALYHNVILATNKLSILEERLLTFNKHHTIYSQIVLASLTKSHFSLVTVMKGLGAAVKGIDHGDVRGRDTCSNRTYCGRLGHMED